MNKKLVLAAALSGVVAAGTLTSLPQAQAKTEGQCHGVNGCKGQGACGGASHDCAGKNACQGKGWIKTTKKECEMKMLEAAKKRGILKKAGLEFKAS